VVFKHFVHLHTYGALVVFQFVDTTSFLCRLFRFLRIRHTRKINVNPQKKPGYLVQGNPAIKNDP